MFRNSYLYGRMSIFHRRTILRRFSNLKNELVEKQMQLDQPLQMQLNKLDQICKIHDEKFFQMRERIVNLENNYEKLNENEQKKHDGVRYEMSVTLLLGMLIYGWFIRR